MILKVGTYEDAIEHVAEYIRGFANDDVDHSIEAEAIVAAALVCRYEHDGHYLGVLPRTACKFRVPIEVLVPWFDRSTIPDLVAGVIEHRRAAFLFDVIREWGNK